MNVGATSQEVIEAKKETQKQAEQKRENGRRRTPKDAEGQAIYYYNGDWKEDSYRDFSEIYVPIENYSTTLIRQLDFYLNKVNRSLDVDTVETLVTLRSVIFPNNKELQISEPTQSIAVWEMVRRYTKCIMKMVGELAECVLVDTCANNTEVNKICINIALFKNEILNTYDIPYDEYVAYSTSFMKMVYKDPKDGMYRVKDNHHYNPHHTSMDIGWCKRNNIWDQLRVEMKELKYIDIARLQVKATLDCNNLDLENYILTPVIVFDFDHGINKLKQRYPHYVIYSANELFPELALQMEKYFQIIAAYVSGLTNRLNITENDLKNDRRLQTLFRTSAHEITSQDKVLDKMGIIKLAEDADKPVLLGV